MFIIKKVLHIAMCDNFIGASNVRVIHPIGCFWQLFISSLILNLHSLQIHKKKRLYKRRIIREGRKKTHQTPLQSRDEPS
jgi:hypothetical protein